MAIGIHVKQNCIFLRADLPNAKSITAYSKRMYNKLECPQSTSQNLITYKQSYTFPNPGESNIQVVNSSWNKLSSKYLERTGRVRVLLHVLAFIFRPGSS